MTKAGYSAVALFLSALGCRRDMQVQPKYMPLAGSMFFADGRASRPTPPGVIATDEVDQEPGVSTGTRDETFVSTIPVPVTAEFLKRGRERYDIYCSPCHGRTGDGRGMIALRGFQIPANLNGPRVQNAPPGYLY